MISFRFGKGLFCVSVAFGWLVWLSPRGIAESNGVPPAVPPPGAGYNWGPRVLPNNNNLKVFDDDFFKTAPKEGQGNQASGNGTTPKGRAYAEDPTYNTDNRDQALAKCGHLKNQNFSKYQECYQQELSGVKKGIQESYDRVEDRQKVPLRNAPNPLVEEQRNE